LAEAYPYVSKRLLTDPAPELRTSLRDLLFRDGSFRWNRLENLLKNARGNDEYDLNLVLNQATEFLTSERGELIRNNLVDEIVKALEAFGRSTIYNFTSLLRDRVGLTSLNDSSIISAEQQKTLDHIKRILSILRETRGFDPATFIPQSVQLLVNPGVQRLGQQIAGRLAQKALTKLIRDLLTEEEIKQVIRS
jgi:hypothetical protein